MTRRQHTIEMAILFKQYKLHNFHNPCYILITLALSLFIFNTFFFCGILGYIGLKDDLDCFYHVHIQFESNKIGSLKY